jgi:glycosyltransferase involved in cell wall biosynthesis
VTIAVPVKDRRERMLECLDALLAQDHPSFEVLVLDNDSSDGTVEACRARARNASVDVRVESVSGTLGRVRNRAAALARGRVIAFTDSDCSPTPGWLSAGVAALDADPELGMVCGVTVPPALPRRTWSKNVTVREFTWRFESCNAMFRREAFGAHGAFDEVVGDGWEDTAAGFEVLRRGWRAGFCADAVVHHDVTYPGFWFHVRREQRQANLGHVVRQYPELRERLLYARVFLNARQAACLIAVAGLAAGRARPAARLLALPYAGFIVPRVLPWRMAQLVVLDLAMHFAVIRGAMRYRAFVL